MAKITKTLKKTAKQAAKGKQDKAAAARGGTKPAKGKAMPQRSSTVKEHQKGLAKMGAKTIGEAAYWKAAEAGVNSDMRGHIYGKTKKKAEKKALKSFRKSS